MTENKRVRRSEEAFERVEQKHIESVFRWFKQNKGKLFDKSRVHKTISEDTGVPKHDVSNAINILVKNVVCPVMQTKDANKVGIKQYNVFDGGYSFVKYKDEVGEVVQVVCQHCNKEATYDTQSSESLLPRSNENVREQLVIDTYQHYADDHDIEPESVSSTLSSESGIDLIPLAHEYMS